MTGTVIWICATCRAANRAVDLLCEACGRARSQAPEPEPSTPGPLKACADCAQTVTLWTALTIGDDGLRRCAMCHYVYLGRRAGARSDRCTEPGCTKTAGEHIDEFRVLMDKLAWKFPSQRS